MLCYSSITCLGFGLTHCFIDIQILIYKSFALFSHQMCLRDVKVPATAGCMVGGIMDQGLNSRTELPEVFSTASQWPVNAATYRSLTSALVR